MLAAAAVDALYIVAIGGDYMHGRLLLPAFFALALPASLVVAARRARATTRRSPGCARRLGARERRVVPAAAARARHRARARARSPTGARSSGATMKPIDIALGLNGKQAAAAYARGVRGYFKVTDKRPRPGRDPNAFVLTLGSIGVPAYDAGTHVWVIDIGGLAEPLAARTAPVPGRQAGHRKQIDYAWYDARFGGAERRDPKVVAARHALTCGPVAGLLEAVDAKMTPGRFFSNIWHSVSYTRLRVPSDPIVAEREWC